MKLNRREFLKTTGALAAIVGTSGIALASAPGAVEPERYFAIFYAKSNNWYRIAVPTPDVIWAAVKDGTDLGEFLRPWTLTLSKADQIVSYDDGMPDTFFLKTQPADSTMELLRTMPITSLNRVIEAEGIEV